ncbi:MAG TPA: hypothetical protein DCP90_02810 [Clostridiales bacterium]|nr:MAG: hypothetical protein A2Y22_00055 [Clostridiales bacterium GWD2_32_59]HAN09524.1 hypothetical protein [Clostridiales bacterium]
MKRVSKKIRIILFLSIMVLTIVILQNKTDSNSVLPVFKTVEDKTNKCVPILMYHGFTKDDENVESQKVSAKKFESDMKYLYENKYNTIFAKDLSGNIPDKSVVITFDDGYLDNYEVALPILKKYNFKATIFIIGWSVGRDKMLDGQKKINPHFSWEQAKQLIESGLINIENHTYDLHSPEGTSYGYGDNCGLGLSRLKDETDDEYKKRIGQDIKKLKMDIKENLNYTSEVFAYPYGITDKLAVEVLKENGYVIALTTEDRIADILLDDLYLMPRLNVSNDIYVKGLLESELENEFIDQKSY